MRKFSFYARIGKVLQKRTLDLSPCHAQEVRLLRVSDVEHNRLTEPTELLHCFNMGARFHGSSARSSPDSRYPTSKMSFLDNLENNLKALESRTERDPATLAREAAAREAARSAALQIAPHAEALRNGPFLGGFLTACRSIGHSKRILVRPVWVDSTLRLEVGAKKLELRPTATGVVAVFFDGGKEIRSMPIDLASDPVKLAEQWLD